MHLAIVQRGQLATFELLARTFTGDPNVRVVWDRRVRNRRQSVSPIPAERRRRDRRRASSTSWGHHDYILVCGTSRVPNSDLLRETITPADAHLTAVAATNQEIHRDIEDAVWSDVNVLITGGDPRTRKALAHLIHQRSHRRDGPFVVIDRAGSVNVQGSAPGGSALGNDSGSNSNEASWAEWAAGGTLFIEEVGELTWKLQTELLHFLDRRALQRLLPHAGALRDTRVIAATSHRLLDRSASKNFRVDLFYRLNVLHLMLASGTRPSKGS